MSETGQRTRGKSEKRRQKEREERFFSLLDRVQILMEQTVEEEHDIKDLKQITGALKELKELIFEKNDRNGEKSEGMTIKIEGDVEEC